MASAREAFCSTMMTVRPPRASSASVSKTVFTYLGDRPSEGSSRMIAVGAVISAVDEDLAFPDRQQAARGLDRRGLAGAVGADDGGGAAARERHGRVLHHGHVAVPGGDRPQLEEGLRCGVHAISACSRRARER